MDDWGHCHRCGREGTITEDLRASDARCYACEKADDRAERDQEIADCDDCADLPDEECCQAHR